jgi:hypothetical protein
MYWIKNNENLAFLNFPKNCDLAGFVMAISQHVVDRFQSQDRFWKGQ